jgi:hypothetical protein
MLWVVGGVVLLALAAAFAIVLQLSRGRLAIAVFAPAILMAAFGAFAGSAAAALATAETASGGLLRGAANGFLMGLAVGVALAAVVFVARRLRAK